MALRRRSNNDQLNPWPGFVDALSTLLMVIIFVLLVFVLAQAFLSVALSGRDRALDRVNRQMAELADLLSLERGRTKELQLSLSQLTRDLQSATSARDTLGSQLETLRKDQAGISADRDSLKIQRDTLAAKLADTELQAQSMNARTLQLQQQLADIAKQSDASGQQAAARIAATRQDAAKQITDSQAKLTDAQSKLADTQSKLADAQTKLAATQRLFEEMQKQAADLDKTVKADRDTIAARLSDLAKMSDQVKSLSALRDDLERQVREATAKTMSEAQLRAAAAAQLADEKKFSDSARAQIALLTQQVEQLRAQLASIGKTLEASETSAKDKDVQIANLGSRLNAALAQKVEELQRYRSDFFGRLREVLANRPGIQVVGDRFVFQSEVLFPVGSADLSQAGTEQIGQLAATLKQISDEIPKDVNWVLRVDGHADKQPLSTGKFGSNWELSSARAINVVRLLIAQGIPANRLAATAFGDNQPLDPADTPEAYAKNRRIEIRLTDR